MVRLLFGQSCIRSKKVSLCTGGTDEAELMSCAGKDLKTVDGRWRRYCILFGVEANTIEDYVKTK